MQAEPEFADFTRSYEARQPSVLWTRLVADLETPVSAMLKLADGRPFSFLFESVEGGAVRGRYSFIGLKPDLIWRCRGDTAEINRHALTEPQKFERLAGGALAGLRSLIAESRIAVPPQLPPMAAGLFGYMGYETVRLMERLPDKNPDPIGIPDAVFLRPTVVAIFDNVEDLVTVVTPVWPNEGRSARQAYDDACKRLADVIADFDRSLPLKREAEGEPLSLPAPVSNVTQPRYHEIVEQAKEYIRAGDIFQVVPSHRFHSPFPLPPFSLYRALRRLNPSPFLFFLDFGGFQLVGSSPEILVRLRDGKVTIRPIAGTRPPRQDAGGRPALEAGADRRSQGARRAPDAARPRPQRCRPCRQDRHACGSPRKFFDRALQPCDAPRLQCRGDAPDGLDPVDVLMAAFPAGTALRRAQGAGHGDHRRAGDRKARRRLRRRGRLFRRRRLGGHLHRAAHRAVQGRRMYVQAGGGVVADSDPEAEYEETLTRPAPSPRGGGSGEVRKQAELAVQVGFSGPVPAGPRS